MAIDPKKLLPSGSPDTPEGNVDREGSATEYVTEKQYNTLNKNILAIRSNLVAIADLLLRRGQQEDAQDNEEIKTRRRESDRTAKGEQENFIESAVKTSLVKPVQEIEKKVRGPFGNFVKALEALFLGWLSLKGVDALQAWQEGDTKKLDQIKNDLVKGLLVAGGIGLALNGGIGAITGIFSSLVTNLVFQLPKLIGLMANPYVWLGAAAVYGGIKILEIVNSMGASSQGRGSYESYTQEIIDIISDKGKQAALDELNRRRSRLLKQNPWLSNPIFRTFSREGSILNEIDQNIEQINKGTFDMFTKESLTDDEKTRVNNIAAAIDSLSGYKDQYDDLSKQMKNLLGTKLVGELSPEDKKKYEALEAQHDALYSNMMATMKHVNSERDKMSQTGKDFVDARIGRIRPDMFKQTGVDFETTIPFLNLPINVKAGDPDPSRLEGLDELKGLLDKSLGKPTVEPQEVSSSTQGMMSTVASLEPAIQETKQALIGSKKNLGDMIASQPSALPPIVVQPYSKPRKETMPPSTTAAATEYPSIKTSNPYNFNNIDYSTAQYA